MTGGSRVVKKFSSRS